MFFFLFVIIFGIINFLIGLKQACIVTGFLYAVYTLCSIGALLDKQYAIFAHWLICTGGFFACYKIAIWRLKKEDEM